MVAKNSGVIQTIQKWALPVEYYTYKHLPFSLLLIAKYKFYITEFVKDSSFHKANENVESYKKYERYSAENVI